MTGISCDDEDGPVLPDVSGVTFVEKVTNPYFPLPEGASWRYESKVDEGTEVIKVSVPGTTKTIQGVKATIVRDTAYLNDEIIEDTVDWFAQDSEGNVWYLGEDTCVFKKGKCSDKKGSWMWGKEGALPGIAMPAKPTVDGKPYRQEYFVGHAEDVGEVLSVEATVETPVGTFKNCVKTHDTSTLDLKLDELKYYCKGIGLVLTKEGDVREALTKKSGL